MSDVEAQTEVNDRPSGFRVNWGLIGKIAMAVVALIALVFLGRQLGGYVPRFALWVEGLGFWGPAVFAGGYAAATVAFIPGSILTLAAGAIFGLGKGTAIVLIGATFGASAAFLISRYGARTVIEKRLENQPRFKTIDQAVGREGLKIVFLLRLSPVFPFNLLNYALGLTKVRFRDYVLASFGMLPGTFLYVYYGKALGSVVAVAGGAQADRGSEQWIGLGVGLVATLLVTTVITRIARKALQQEVESD